MSDLCHPDIEIYIRHCNLQQLERWLRSRCSGMNRRFSQGRIHEYRSVFNGAQVPILVHEKVVGIEWTSIWFRSNRTPWRRDLDCALEVARALQTQVRCLTSDWIRGRGQRKWWNIEAGRMNEMIWQ